MKAEAGGEVVCGAVWPGWTAQPRLGEAYGASGDDDYRQADKGEKRQSLEGSRRNIPVFPRIEHDNNAIWNVRKWVWASSAHTQLTFSLVPAEKSDSQQRGNDCPGYEREPCVCRCGTADTECMKEYLGGS